MHYTSFAHVRLVHHNIGNKLSFSFAHLDLLHHNVVQFVLGGARHSEGLVIESAGLFIETKEPNLLD